MISLTNRNKAILLLTLVLFVMLPFDFTWNDTALNYMSFDEEPVSAVLFWVFYISVTATAMAAIVNRYDIAKLASLVSMVFIVILIIQTINTVSYGKVYTFLEAMFWETQLGYAYIAITAGIFFLARKGEAK